MGPDWERNEDEKKVCQALEKVAAEVGAKSITAGQSAHSRFFYTQAHSDILL